MEERVEVGPDALPAVLNEQVVVLVCGLLVAAQVAKRVVGAVFSIRTSVEGWRRIKVNCGRRAGPLRAQPSSARKVPALGHSWTQFGLVRLGCPGLCLQSLVLHLYALFLLRVVRQVLILIVLGRLDSAAGQDLRRLAAGALCLRANGLKRQLSLGLPRR